MDFPYFKETIINGNLEVDDIGNCAIEAMNDNAECWVLVIDTMLGTSRIFKYGPYNYDLDMLPKNVLCSFSRIPFSEFKLKKEIDSFLNSPFANITQARVVDKYEALNNCKSIIEYMKQDVLY